MSFGARTAKAQEAFDKIVALVKETGAEIEENERPAGAALLTTLDPVSRLLRWFPDCRFRWPGTAWGLLDTKANDFIELGAWMTYMDLCQSGRLVVVARPDGWALIQNLKLASSPNGGYLEAEFAGHLWQCPRLGGYGEGNGSGTPYSHAAEDFKVLPYAFMKKYLGMLLVKDLGTTTLEYLYQQS